MLALKLMVLCAAITAICKVGVSARTTGDFLGWVSIIVTAVAVVLTLLSHLPS